MKIDRKYLIPYWESMAIDQIAAEYSQKGYEVFKEQPIGQSLADVVAKNDKETVVIEVKIGEMTPEKRENLKQLHRYVQERDHYKFLVALFTPPKEKKLKVDDIEPLLFRYLSEHELHFSLNGLINARLNKISDIDISGIEVSGTSTIIKGDGIINVELRWKPEPPEQEHDFTTNESFPFEFEIVLKNNGNNKMEIVELRQLKVDTSSID